MIWGKQNKDQRSKSSWIINNFGTKTKKLALVWVTYEFALKASCPTSSFILF